MSAANILDFPRMIKRRRLELGLSCAAVAKKAGVCRLTVDRAEQPGGSGSVDTLSRIVHVLGGSVCINFDAGQK